MPTHPITTGQDWGVQMGGRGTLGNKPTVPKSGRELAQAKAMGLVTTEKRHVAGGANRHTATIMSARKLDEATEATSIARVDKELSRAIAQARTAMKLSQKDLATAINSKPQLIAEYENGKAIPDGRIIAMLEKKLSTKLPRPGKTKPPPNASITPGATTSQPKSNNGVLTRGTGPPKRR